MREASVTWHASHERMMRLLLTKTERYHGAVTPPSWATALERSTATRRGLGAGAREKKRAAQLGSEARHPIRP